jgi:hypothetical protein
MHYRLPISENSEQRQSFIAAALYAMGITLAYNLHVQGSDKQG